VFAAEAFQHTDAKEYGIRPDILEAARHGSGTGMNDGRALRVRNQDREGQSGAEFARAHGLAERTVDRAVDGDTAVPSEAGVLARHQRYRELAEREFGSLANRDELLVGDT
jgi:hypothetical protein